MIEQVIWLTLMFIATGAFTFLGVRITTRTGIDPTKVVTAIMFFAFAFVMALLSVREWNGL